MASEQNFSERLSSLLPYGKKGKLAAYCGVEASTVSRWLSGQTMPVGESCFKIAQFLGVDAKWLMSGDTAESYAKPKEPLVRETAQQICEIPMRLHDEPVKYRANVDPVAAAFAKIREGLDLLEQLMKNPPP